MSLSLLIRVAPENVSDALEKLREAGGSLEHHRYAEIWVEHDDFPALCALINGDVGWLMFLRYEGDVGFSTRNLDYHGPPDAKVEFILGNGQRDEYPTAWTYPTDRVLSALESFAATAKLPDDMDWHNDSGDGSTPNDPIPDEG